MPITRHNIEANYFFILYTLYAHKNYTHIKYYTNLNTLNPKVASKNVVIHIFIILDKEDIIYIIGDPMVS